MKSAMRILKYGTLLDRFLKLAFVVWCVCFFTMSFYGWKAWQLLECNGLEAEWEQVKAKTVRLAKL